MAAVAVVKTVQELKDDLQITPVDEGIDDWINALFFGYPGAGKTHLLGTAADDPRTSPVLILDVEGGLRTLRKFPNKHNIERIVVRSLKDIDDKYNLLYHSIAEGTFPYKTIGIDSGTELADLDMRLIMADAYQRNPEKVNIDVPSPREWGIARNHMRKLIRAFKDLPCNFIMTAQLGEKTEEGQPTQLFPGFAGKLVREAPGFFDVVGYLSVDYDPTGGPVTRKLQVQGTRRVIAKDRDDLLGGLIENPTIPQMWEKIHGDNIT
jgi:AAA domain